ncbi:protein of unknown function DUF721 [Leadbetterella byssophila DSM 17132]|jgi:hypothetical protein|uniref:DUF721 domain-containing protein n=1 Tax=Leadbetterella byssophila (strain DSM 17132 / JCM 16389 / KACC 11308 / NBRC 106382 / 4M15) TaxID=649349 RepID=E4RQ33_LEAB4|nr:DUF721 domain-containing protein [Leadbetterella byssophila]ADQ16516.1 protein of unknown function DUF721 [Leadbetterella byssophila DSM 17132]
MSVTARKTQAQSVGEAFEAFLNAYKLRSRYNETYLVAYWEKLMGTSIAQRTEKLYINRGVLFLGISSAPLRQELVLAKSRIIALLNKEMGSEIITDVVFI